MSAGASLAARPGAEKEHGSHGTVARRAPDRRRIWVERRGARPPPPPTPPAPALKAQINPRRPSSQGHSDHRSSPRWSASAWPSSLPLIPAVAANVAALGEVDVSAIMPSELATLCRSLCSEIR